MDNHELGTTEGGMRQDMERKQPDAGTHGLGAAEGEMKDTERKRASEGQ